MLLRRLLQGLLQRLKYGNYLSLVAIHGSRRRPVRNMDTCQRPANVAAGSSTSGSSQPSNHDLRLQCFPPQLYCKSESSVYCDQAVGRTSRCTDGGKGESGPENHRPIWLLLYCQRINVSEGISKANCVDLSQLGRNRCEKGRLEADSHRANSSVLMVSLKALTVEVPMEQAQVQDCVYGIIFLGTSR